MPIYNCHACKKDLRCSLQNDYARVSLFAFGRNHAVPDCPWHQPDSWHGVDGVANVHRVPATQRTSY